jgi:hypothetical protein
MTQPSYEMKFTLGLIVTGQFFILPYFFICTLTSCTNRFDKEIYGKYENNDTVRFVFSEINLYENNSYSFYNSTCFNHVRDSGKFILSNGRLSFQSFGINLDSTNQGVKNLNEINFLYQSDKVLYVRQIKPFNKPSYFDTVLIGKKKT